MPAWPARRCSRLTSGSSCGIVRQPGRFLDLGCGTGRLLIALARRGHWTLGVDLSAPMLAAAAEKARQAGVAVNMLQANLTQLGCLADGCFDGAACLFSTLGMVLGSKERQRVAAHVFRLLRPGGRFVLHVHNRWFDRGMGRGGAGSWPTPGGPGAAWKKPATG